MNKCGYIAYLSSTLEDLGPERQAVQEALGGLAIIKQSYSANESDLVRSCLADVAACDIYIGIVGLRYGYVPKLNNPSCKSITELEYEEACRNNIPCYIFLKAPDAITAVQTDAYNKCNCSGTLISNFRSRLGAGEKQRPSEFRTADELKYKSLEAFNAFGSAIETMKVRERDSEERYPSSALPLTRCQEYVSRGAIEQELHDRILRENRYSIVGIGGMGGIGKTELARNLALAYLEKHPGKVLWISLSDSSLRQIQRYMADQLGCDLNADDTDSQRALALRMALQKTPRLLVFDDVHPEFFDDIKYCLPPCPPCSLIITSRCQAIPALPPGSMRTLEGLTQEQCLTLLQGIPNLSKIISAETDSAKKLCSYCGYNPLALTLAARRLLFRLNDSSTPIATFVGSLRERLLELRYDGADAQSSAEKNLNISYEELSEYDKRCFRSLSTFASSGFCLNAVAALWRVSNREARDTLERLQNLSLVMDAPVPGRFCLHDLLSELSAVHGGKAGEMEDWFCLHAEWLVSSFARHRSVDFVAAPQLAYELDNVRRIVTWASTAGKAEILARLATTACYWFNLECVGWNEWIEWLERALKLGIPDAKVRGQTLKTLGNIQQHLNKEEIAKRYHVEALSIFRELDLQIEESEELQAIGEIQKSRDDFEGAAKTYASALNILRKFSPSRTEAGLLIKWGELYEKQKDFVAAGNSYLQGAEAYRATNSKLGEADALRHLGEMHKDSAPDTAEHHYTKALEIYSGIEDSVRAGEIAQALGDIQERRNDTELARKSYVLAQEFYVAAYSSMWESEQIRMTVIRQRFFDEFLMDIPCLNVFFMYRSAMLPLNMSLVSEKLGHI